MQRILGSVAWMVICCFGWGAPTLAEEVGDKTPGVYVILDGSGSMWGQLSDGTHKITAAKEVIRLFSADDYAGRELALRVYGHRRKGDCSDSELVVPFSPPDQAIDRMNDFAQGVNPKGKTPISRSLRAALEDFAGRPGEVILVSDGIETCEEDPCALVRQWRAQDVQIRVHVVGLGLVDKERAAMQCISEAAGTQYRDADSAAELAKGLEEIQTSAKKTEARRSQWKALDIKATNAAGVPMRVQGTAHPQGGEPIEVTSRNHNPVPTGPAEVTVGVRTWNGNLYRPVTRSVDVGDSGVTLLEVVVEEPPSVKARFVEQGEERGGALVRGFQDDKEVLRFRHMDRAYVDPGTYVFRSRPNADNEMEVSETLAAGDHKEIVFDMVQTVHIKLAMVAAGSDTRFRGNFELWQDGERKYKVHQHNGARVLPGTYDVKLPLRLTPHTHEGLVITGEAKQERRLEVPVGYVTFRYLDAAGQAMSPQRVFATRQDDDGRWVRDQVSKSEERIPLVPGTYRAEGWSKLGNFDVVDFEISVGDDKKIVLRDKGPK